MDQKISLNRTEVMNFSPRHDILGYYICRNWGLSTDVENVVRWHHEYNRAERNVAMPEETHEMIDLVILANWLVKQQEFGFSGNEFYERPSDAFLARLNLVPNHLEEINIAVENELKLTKGFCDLLESNS